MKSKIIPLAIILFIGILFLFSFSNTQEKETIKIGFIGPFSGDVAVFGDVEKNAAEIALTEINSNETKIEFIYEDGKCNGKDAVIAANKLINIDKVKILFVVCGAENIGIAPLSNEHQVIQFASWASHPELTKISSYVFRNAISDEKIAQTTAKTIFSKYKTVGEIYEENDYCKGLHNAFKTEFEKLGGTLITESFQSENSDLKLQVTKSISKNPEAVFLNPNNPTAGILLIKELKEQGFKGQIYANFFGGSSEVQEMPEAEGLIYFAEPIIEDNSINKEYLEKYIEIYGKEPDYKTPSFSRYDSVYLIKDAIDYCKEVDTDCIRDYFYNLQEFSGALGTYRFDNQGDILGVSPAIMQIQNKQAILFQEN